MKNTKDHSDPQKGTSESSETPSRPRKKTPTNKQSVPILNLRSTAQSKESKHNQGQHSPSQSRTVAFNLTLNSDSPEDVRNPHPSSEPIQINNPESTVTKRNSNSLDSPSSSDRGMAFSSPRRKKSSNQSHSPTRRFGHLLSSDHKHSISSSDHDISPSSSPKANDLNINKAYQSIVFTAIKVFEIEIEDLYYITNILIQVLKGTHKALLENVIISKRKGICNFHSPIQFKSTQTALISTSINDFKPKQESKKYNYFISYKLPTLLEYIYNGFRESIMTGLLSHISECNSHSLYFDNESDLLNNYFCNSSYVIASLSSLCSLLIAPSKLVLNTHIISLQKDFKSGLKNHDFARITTTKLSDLIQYNQFMHLKEFVPLIGKLLFENHKYMLCCTDNENLHLSRFLYLLNKLTFQQVDLRSEQIEYAIHSLKQELLLSEKILIKHIIQDISLSFLSMTSAIPENISSDMLPIRITDNASYNLLETLKEDLLVKRASLSPFFIETGLVLLYSDFDSGLKSKDFKRITIERIFNLIKNAKFTRLEPFSVQISKLIFDKHKYMFCSSENDTLHLSRFLYLLNVLMKQKFSVNSREIHYGIKSLKHELLLSETILIKDIIRHASLGFPSMTVTMQKPDIEDTISPISTVEKPILQISIVEEQTVKTPTIVEPVKQIYTESISSQNTTDNASHNLIRTLKTDLLLKKAKLQSMKKNMCLSNTSQHNPHTSLDLASTPVVHLTLNNPERFRIRAKQAPTVATCSITQEK